MLLASALLLVHAEEDVEITELRTEVERLRADLTKAETRIPQATYPGAPYRRLIAAARAIVEDNGDNVGRLLDQLAKAVYAADEDFDQRVEEAEK